MKVEVKDKQGFAPIVLAITIESKEELISLYTRINIAEGSKQMKEDNNFKDNGVIVVPLMTLFNVLETICQDKL